MELLHLFFGFNGRIGRLAYWLASVFCTVYFLLIQTLAKMVSTQARDLGSVATSSLNAGAMATLIAVLLFLVLALIVGLWSGVAIPMKRWHDRGKSGWWVLIGLIPIVGAIWTFIECGILPGDPGGNRYGPSPDMAQIAATFE